jgi:hypothetical protein
MNLLGDALSDAESASPGIVIVCGMAFLCLIVTAFALSAHNAPQSAPNRTRYTGCFAASNFPPMLISQQTVQLVGSSPPAQWTPFDSKNASLLLLPFRLEYMQRKWTLIADEPPARYARAYHYVGAQPFPVIPNNRKADEIRLSGYDGLTSVEVRFRRVSVNQCVQPRLQTLAVTNQS